MGETISEARGAAATRTAMPDSSGAVRGPGDMRVPAEVALHRAKISISNLDFHYGCTSALKGVSAAAAGDAGDRYDRTLWLRQVNTASGVELPL